MTKLAQLKDLGLNWHKCNMSIFCYDSDWWLTKPTTIMMVIVTMLINNSQPSHFRFKIFLLLDVYLTFLSKRKLMFIKNFKHFIG